MKRKIMTGAYAMSLVVLLASTSAPAIANSSSTSNSGSSGLPSVEISQSAPEGATVMTAADIADIKVLDSDVNLAVSRIVQADTVRAINSVTWDNTKDVMQFYVYGDVSEIRELIENRLPESQAWEIIPSDRSIAELETAIEKLASSPDQIPAGLTFVSGTPAPDGSSITIGVEGTADPLRRAQTIPDEMLGVPVSFVPEVRSDTATRFRAAAPVIAGGYMEGPTSAGDRACTTGYPVLRAQDSQRNMITADHCTDQQNVSWRWGGGSHSVGASTFQAAGDTDLELFVDADSLSAWIFVGSNNDASSVLPIRGYSVPVGGNSVCYSGSRSGLVCSNTVDNSDSYNCVAFLQCYWTRWSTQINGTPAAGNGDSGGPVFMPVRRSLDDSIGAYGVGVISMIPGGSPAACTGDPGASAVNGRKCSPRVGFAPLSRWTSAQSTHLLAYTNQ